MRYENQINSNAIFLKENFIIGFKHPMLQYGGHFIFHSHYKNAPDLINEYIEYCQKLSTWILTRGNINTNDKRYKLVEDRFKLLMKNYEYQF